MTSFIHAVCDTVRCDVVSRLSELGVKVTDSVTDSTVAFVNGSGELPTEVSQQIPVDRELTNGLADFGVDNPGSAERRLTAMSSGLVGVVHSEADVLSMLE